MEQHYSFIVVGGGFTGCAAAIAAARAGVKTLLIEKFGALGGAPCTCYVNPFMGFTVKKADGSSYVINRGLFLEMFDRLKKMGGIRDNSTTFNEEYLKIMLDEMCEEAGVDVLFHAYLHHAEVADDRVTAITVSTVEGDLRFTADYFLDSTGDAMLCELAGAPYHVGREEDQKCQPMTLCFRMANVDRDNFWRERPELNRIYKEEQAAGKILNPREDILNFSHTSDGVLHLNSTRVIGLSPVNAMERSKAEVIARKQMLELFLFLKKHAKTCENATLLSSASEIGVRESRMIDGLYTITADDIVSCKKFEDAIAVGNYEIDIHSPDGTGTTHVRIPDGQYYTLPYRALLPKKFENLIVAGRCISSTHEAQASYRIMPICAVMGHAAGLAVVQAIEEHCALPAISIASLHKKMDQADLLYC